MGEVIDVSGSEDRDDEREDARWAARVEFGRKFFEASSKGVRWADIPRSEKLLWIDLALGRDSPSPHTD